GFVRGSQKSRASQSTSSGTSARPRRNVSSPWLTQTPGDGSNWSSTCRISHRPSARSPSRSFPLWLTWEAKMEREDREALWGAIASLVRRPRAFATAAWALPAAEVDRLAHIADRLRPDDVVESHRWLFETHLPDLGEAHGAASERLEDVADARRRAIQQV